MLIIMMSKKGNAINKRSSDDDTLIYFEYIEYQIIETD